MQQHSSRVDVEMKSTNEGKARLDLCKLLGWQRSVEAGRRRMRAKCKNLR